MKKRLFWYLVTFMCLLSINIINAKESTIKYGKNIVYIGNVEDKMPQGEGKLMIMSTHVKNQEFLTINGFFNGLKISYARIYPNSMTSIECFSDIDINCVGEKGKASSIAIYFNNVKIKSRFEPTTIDQICISNLNILVSQEKKDSEWQISLDSGLPETNTFTATYKNEIVPDDLKSIKCQVSDIINVTSKFSIGANCIQEVSNPQYLLIDESIYCDGTLKYRDGNKVILDNKSWRGVKVLNDGRKIERENDEFRITSIDGSYYEGDIEYIYSPLYVNVLDNPNITFLNGIETSGDKKIRWINGENEEARHIRLSSFLEDKWIEKVESGEISEKQAIEEQNKEREHIRLQSFLNDSLVALVEAGEISELEAKEKQEIYEEHIRLQSFLSDWLVDKVESGEISEHEAIDLQKKDDNERREKEERKKMLPILANELKTRYGGRKVVLVGKSLHLMPSTPLKIPGIYKPTGINDSHITGGVALALVDNGEAELLIKINPTNKVKEILNKNELLGFKIICDRLSKLIKGEWSIEDEKILFDGKDIGLKFQNDRKTISYKGNGVSTVLKVNEITK